MSGSAARLSLGLAQMEVIPGDPARNAGTALRMLDEAREGGLDALFLPELCLSGYLLGDMWEREAFLRECAYWQERLVRASGDMLVVFGNVVTEWGEKGEDGRPRKYNGYVAAHRGKALLHPGLGRPYGVKTLLPDYREFEEPRHFYDLRKLALEGGKPWEDLLQPFEVDLGAGKRGAGESFRLGVILCEDAWEDDYAQKPLSVLGSRDCHLIANLSCSPFTAGKNDKRNRVFAAKARQIGAPLLYVNSIGLQNNGKTVFTFDGRSTCYQADGGFFEAVPAFAERLARVSLQGDVLEREGISKETVTEGMPPSSIASLHAALRFGAERFLRMAGIGKVVVGASGGIDSAVAAALYAGFLPPENLLLVNMPSRFNSRTTRSLAFDLARNLDCLYCEIGIEDSVALTRAQVDGLEAKSPSGNRKVTLGLSGFHLENVQARDRSSRVLAALAASFGGAFTCNANKAEMTVGYSTLYGDLGGFLALLGDLWKGEVYALGRYLNETVFGREVIPEGVFTVRPSAELSAAQAVEEGRGDPLVYPYHDRLFFAFVQRWRRWTPEEALESYLEGSLNEKLALQGVDSYALFPGPEAFVEDLEKWWNLYNGMGVAKRIQAPPVLAVSSRAFGFDHREHQGRPFYSTRYLEMKAAALEKAQSREKTESRGRTGP